MLAAYIGSSSASFNQVAQGNIKRRTVFSDVFA